MWARKFDELNLLPMGARAATFAAGVAVAVCTLTAQAAEIAPVASPGTAAAAHAAATPLPAPQPAAPLATPAPAPLAPAAIAPAEAPAAAIADTALGRLALNSARALVVDEATGTVLLAKNAQDTAPMASLTKLLTAMVVLDARQDADEALTVGEEDLDTLKHTYSGVPPGRTLTRGALLERALLASDNHAAACLARHYPGGMNSFLAAMRQKIVALRLTQTVVEEPTGLSPQNRSSAADLVAVLQAASAYPQIERITSQARARVPNGASEGWVKNTNALVGKKGWDILLSKTGYTNEAGRCLAMRLRAAGRTLLLVLLDSPATSLRSLDALNITRLLAGHAELSSLPSDLAPRAAGVRKRARAKATLRA